MPLHPDAVEVVNEVYDAHCQSFFVKRSHFVATDFWLFSSSVLKSRPYILDVIVKMYGRCCQPKQMGLGILHGALTLVRFRPSLSLFTFPDEAPLVKPGHVFIGPADFAEVIGNLRSRLVNLEYNPIEQPQTANAFRFVCDFARRFGSSVYLLLDEIDFHTETPGFDSRMEALEVSRCQGQVSVLAFVDRLVTKNPLLELPVITGGSLLFFPSKSSQREVSQKLCDVIRAHTYHDAKLWLRAPNGGEIREFAGRGFQTSLLWYTIGKAVVGECFYFGFDVNKLRDFYVQMVVFYTSEISVRKMRVVTLNLRDLVPGNPLLANEFVTGIVLHRALVEGEEAARARIKQFEKNFTQFGSSVAERAKAVMAEKDLMEFYRQALACRYGIKPTENDSTGSIGVVL
jgi:hypothetical protein